MKVVVYTPGYNEKLAEVMLAFAEGVPDAVVRDQDDFVPDADVAVVFGTVKAAFKKTWTKKRIIEHHSGERELLVIESAFFRRGEYYQIGWGGYSGYADFRTEGSPIGRWNEIGIPSKPWQNRPDGPIVVCGQLPRDTQVQDVDHIGWCRRMVKTLVNAGYFVRFRPHPKVEFPFIYGLPKGLYDVPKLRISLSQARCYVTWNSTSGVDAAIAGVPVIAMERGSMAWPVAGHSLDDIENIPTPDRTAWLAGLAYSQWTLDEMRAGFPWLHLTRPVGSPVPDFSIRSDVKGGARGHA